MRQFRNGNCDMKLSQIVVVFAVLLIALNLFSCEMNDSDTENYLNNTITAQVRVGWLTDQPPRSSVRVAIFKYESSDSSMDTASTNDAGEVVFDSLETGVTYVIELVESDEYDRQYDGPTINLHQLESSTSKASNDTIRIPIHYYWNFNRYEHEIVEDTTTNFVENGHTFYNNGIRDTLICQFDRSYIPEWLDFTVRRDTFPPRTSTPEGFPLMYEYQDDLIPLDSLPYEIPIMVTHQYGEVLLKWIVRLK